MNGRFLRCRFRFAPAGGQEGPHRRAEALVTHWCHRLPGGTSPTEERWEPAPTRRSPPAADFSLRLAPAVELAALMDRCRSNAQDHVLWAAHSHRLDHRLPIGTPQSSSWVTSSNIGICATMGLIPSRASAHHHRVDRRCPSKHQKTSVDVSLNRPFRPLSRRLIPECDRPTRRSNPLSFRSSPTFLERVRPQNEVTEYCTESRIDEVFHANRARRYCHSAQFGEA
jgi:hypothetical protein